MHVVETDGQHLVIQKAAHGAQIHVNQIHAIRAQTATTSVQESKVPVVTTRAPVTPRAGLSVPIN